MCRRYRALPRALYQVCLAGHVQLAAEGAQCDMTLRKADAVLRATPLGMQTTADVPSVALEAVTAIHRGHPTLT